MSLSIPLATPSPMLRRTPRQLARLALTALAHLVMVASLVLVTPQLVRSVGHGGRSTCDLSHLTAKQALTGSVCGRRLFDVDITVPAATAAQR